MSDTTITNIPSALETRVKEPSDGAPHTSGSGGPSSDRFNWFNKILRKCTLFFKAEVYCNSDSIKSYI